MSLAAYEEVQALLKIIADPKEAQKLLDNIKLAVDKQTKEREDSIADREEASQARATALLYKQEAQKVNDATEVALAEMKALRDKADLLNAQAQAQIEANNQRAKKLDELDAELGVKRRALDERELQANQRDKEVADLKADLERRLSVLKQAAA